MKVGCKTKDEYAEWANKLGYIKQILKVSKLKDSWNLIIIIIIIVFIGIDPHIASTARVIIPILTLFSYKLELIGKSINFKALWEVR